MKTLILLHRPDCHLCQSMQEELVRLQKIHPFELDLIDIDRDSELELKYGFYVPVLQLEGQTLCYYYFNREKVLAALS